MSPRSSEDRERHHYAEASISQAINTLRDPQISRQLGRWSTLFIAQLESATTVHIVDGEVLLPPDYDYGLEPLPVLAMLPGEELTLSGIFDSQTAEQRRNTLRVFESWKPKDASAEAAYTKIVEDLGGRALKTAISLHDLTTAMTGTSSRAYEAWLLQTFFQASPAEGVAMVRNRPLLFLKIQPDEIHTSPDGIVHELVHYRQAELDPVILAKSQRSLDMSMLRLELEAYHVGAPISIRIHGEWSEKEKANVNNGHTMVQIIVEGIRRFNMLDSSDPFRPSGGLLRKLQEAHVGTILHGSPNYESLLAAARMISQGAAKIE